jgi:hypothetical protein
MTLRPHFAHEGQFREVQDPTLRLGSASGDSGLLAVFVFGEIKAIAEALDASLGVN